MPIKAEKYPILEKKDWIPATAMNDKENRNDTRRESRNEDRRGKESGVLLEFLLF